MKIYITPDTRIDTLHSSMSILIASEDAQDLGTLGGKPSGGIGSGSGTSLGAPGRKVY